MKKAPANSPDNVDMRPEYDFSHGTRGKYADRFKPRPGCYLVSIDLELRRFFPDDQSVNAALHALAEIARAEARTKPRRKSA